MTSRHDSSEQFANTILFNDSIDRAFKGKQIEPTPDFEAAQELVILQSYSENSKDLDLISATNLSFLAVLFSSYSKFGSIFTALWLTFINKFKFVFYNL